MNEPDSAKNINTTLPIGEAKALFSFTVEENRAAAAACKISLLKETIYECQ